MKQEEHMHQTTGKDYLPLLGIIALICFVAGIAVLYGNPPDRLYAFLVYVMAGVFLVFGGLKLLDLKGFADRFAAYDLLAMRWRGYGYLYPFVEFGFGLVMLAGFHPDWLLWTEAGLMAFGGIGILTAMKKGRGVVCACLGTLFKIPLTSASFVENGGMAVLAVWLIFF